MSCLDLLLLMHSCTHALVSSGLVSPGRPAETVTGHSHQPQQPPLPQPIHESTNPRVHERQRSLSFYDSTLLSLLPFSPSIRPRFFNANPVFLSHRAVPRANPNRHPTSPGFSSSPSVESSSSSSSSPSSSLPHRQAR